MLQSDQTDHHGDLRAEVSKKYDIFSGEGHPEDDNTGSISEHHTAIRIPERRAHNSVHLKARDILQSSESNLKDMPTVAVGVFQTT